jgi:hypothetical protein
MRIGDRQYLTEVRRDLQSQILDAGFKFSGPCLDCCFPQRCRTDVDIRRLTGGK